MRLVTCWEAIIHNQICITEMMIILGRVMDILGIELKFLLEINTIIP